jgi:hypothetical protein
MNKTLFLITTTRAIVQCHVEKTYSLLLFCIFSFFFRSVLILTFSCLLIVGVDGYFIAPLHTQEHTHTHSVGLLWASDRPIADSSDNTHHS